MARRLLLLTRKGCAAPMREARAKRSHGIGRI
jgi:hypothetical protein